MRITWWGHATVAIDDGGTTLLTDPVLRSRLAHLYRRRGPAPRLAAPNAVVISHLHADHCDLGSLRGLPASTTLIVPRGAAAFLDRKLGGGRDLVEVVAGDEVAVGRLRVHVVPAVHPAGRAPGSRVRAAAVGYLVKGKRTAYFAGDTGLFDGMSGFGPVDIALVPVWGWSWTLGPGHLGPEEAAEAVRRVAPGWAVPIHWGTLWPVGCARMRPDRFTEPGPEFARFTAEKAPAVRVRVLPPGSSLQVDDAAGGPGPRANARLSLMHPPPRAGASSERTTP
jgi:L-ascorbate metabolism protein UlaG (beta-lactamase superfamily)